MTAIYSEIGWDEKVRAFKLGAITDLALGVLFRPASGIRR
jgi:hypothetical protein